MPNIEYMLLQVEITNYNLTAGKNSISNAIFLMWVRLLCVVVLNCCFGNYRFSSTEGLRDLCPVAPASRESVRARVQLLCGR